jgi:sugar (pentulose or hexulose) kinase
MHSDICGLPIYTVEEPDASLIGSAICAAVGSGLYDSLEEASSRMVRIKDKIEPNKANYRKYFFYYKKYKESYHAVKHVMHEISKKTRNIKI